ncbi:helix-turn-helix domain-containing protein [Taibaiella koreensis]|uniref:helix-turn-helix domain-containing protein n=1 Tax=Taibaiella koreensis TaxID=1268548 RepID=UPI0013C2CA05|nr:helix-turn-helix domain-containing protein [Taibaiella koreensis]
MSFKAGITPKLKRLALLMYLQGLGLNHIAKALGISNATVLNWIKAFGLNAGELPSVTQDIRQVALDEMHTYIGSRQTKDGGGMMLISWEDGGYKVLLATNPGVSEECKASSC